jgi:phosphatidylinositol alpha-mannosyltransferase
MNGSGAVRVAMVSPYSWAHPGGVNSHVRGLASEMMRRGHRVTVIAPDDGVAVPGAAMRSAGRSIPVPANRSVAWLALIPGTGASVRRAVSGEDFDVVHVHEPFVPLVSPAAVRASQGRVVGTFHAAGGTRSLPYGLAKVLYGDVRRRLDRLVAVSESARSLVSSYFPGDYELIPNGIDVDRFSVAGERPDSLPAGEPVVLFVGRNEKRKGLPVLLKAFPILQREIPGCRLVLVGEGLDDKTVLRELDGQLRENVSAVGFVGDEELPAYYGAADVFCAPALGGESFGVVLLEAMACGTAVVASDITGYRDVLDRTGGGRLFKSGDPEDLALALVELLKDDGLRGELATKGIEGVREFSWRKVGDRLEECYLGG